MPGGRAPDKTYLKVTLIKLKSRAVSVTFVQFNSNLKTAYSTFAIEYFGDKAHIQERL